MFSKDNLVKFSCTFSAALCAGLIVAIFYFLLIKSLPAFSEIGFSRFVIDKYWSPKPDANQGYFNILPILIGSFFVSILSILIAIPLSVLSAIGIRFYINKGSAHFFEQVFAIFAGIPSVVLGFWGIVTISPLIAKLNGIGPSLLTGAIVLAIMILPTLTLGLLASFKSISSEIFSSAVSLGMSKISCLLKVILPSIKGALIAAVLLSFMRALGETMVVTMLCGNIAKFPSSILSPVRTLTSNIALEMAYAYDIHRSALFVSGLILMLLCTLLVITINLSSREP